MSAFGGSSAPSASSAGTVVPSPRPEGRRVIGPISVTPHKLRPLPSAPAFTHVPPRAWKKPSESMPFLKSVVPETRKLLPPASTTQGPARPKTPAGTDVEMNPPPIEEATPPPIDVAKLRELAAAIADSRRLREDLERRQRLSEEVADLKKRLLGDTRTEKAPIEKAPIEKAPIEKAPVEKAPVEPVEKAPVEKAPIEKAPVSDAERIMLDLDKLGGPSEEVEVDMEALGLDLPRSERDKALVKGKGIVSEEMEEEEGSEKALVKGKEEPSEQMEEEEGSESSDDEPLRRRSAILLEHQRRMQDRVEAFARATDSIPESPDFREQDRRWSLIQQRRNNDHRQEVYRQALAGAIESLPLAQVCTGGRSGVVDVTNQSALYRLFANPEKLHMMLGRTLLYYVTVTFVVFQFTHSASAVRSTSAITMLTCPAHMSRRCEGSRGYSVWVVD